MDIKEELVDDNNKMDTTETQVGAVTEKTEKPVIEDKVAETVKVIPPAIPITKPVAPVTTPTRGRGGGRGRGGRGVARRGSRR